MTVNLKQNDPAFKELAEYADSVKKPLKEVLMSDEHLDQVSTIFFKHMPKMVKWTMKGDKFKTFYKNHREQLTANIS